MSCNIRTKLYLELLDIVGNEENAKTEYSYFKEQKFIDLFGNYINNSEDPSIKERLNEEGEPKLYLNKNLNKFYFKDKYNEPVFYPYTAQGLNKSLTTNEIKLFAKTLALSWYIENKELDYENLTFINKKETVDSLKEFITNRLLSKIDELENHEDFDKMYYGIQLSNTLNNIDEWVTEVNDFFKSLKIENISKEEELLEQQEEDKRGNIWRQESFTYSNKDNINNKVKLFLSTIKIKEDDSVNIFNDKDFINFDDIYSTLNKSLANIVATYDNNGQLEDPYQLYLNKILEISYRKPYFESLYDILSSSQISNNFKNSFVAGFNLHRNNFLGSILQKKNDGNIDYNILNLSEVGVRKSSILTRWKFNFTEKKLNNSDLELIKNKASNLRQQLLKDRKNINSTEELLIQSSQVEDLLKALGIENTLKGFNLFLDNLKYDPSEISINNKIDKLVETLGNIYYGLDRLISGKSFNLFMDQNVFKELAQAESFFMKEGTDASIFTIGKTRWNYSHPSYLDVKIAMWKKDPNILLKHYRSGAFTEGSHYIEFLLDLDENGDINDINVAKENLSKIELGIFNSVQEKGDAFNAVDNNNLSLTDSIVDYVNKVLAFKKGNKVYHKTALAAGKNTEYQIFYGEDSNYFNLSSDAQYSNKTNTIQVNEKISDIAFKYFKSEYYRIAEAYKTINDKTTALIPVYHTGEKNALKSQLFPSLSPTFKNNKVILPKLDFELYDKQGKPLYNNLDEIKDKIIPIINEVISKKILDTYKLLLDNGIIGYDVNNKRSNNAIDDSIYKKYIQESGEETGVIRIAGDIFVNSLVSQVEYSKLFAGDIAYYKNFDDYRKRTQETYTDGLYMRLLNGEEKFNISVIEAVKVDIPYIDELKEILTDEQLKAYLAVNSTDAQAWITPERWKFIMSRIGKWDDRVETIYKKMLKTNPKFSTKELKYLAQPLKGVYFDVINGRPIYLKYSQAVLMPNLIKGTGLEALYNKMVNDENGKKLPYKDQIHELITEDGIKVGASGITKTHDNKGNVLKNFSLSKLQLNNNNWKLQQDLPTKGTKDTDLGSQLQKNIYSGLIYHTDNKNVTFDIGGKTMDATNTIIYLNSLIADLSNKGKIRLFDKLGIDPKTKKIENEDLLYKSLIKQLEKRTDVPANFIKALQAGISPYGIAGGFQMFQNTFSSIVNKETVKIKTNGGSFIQMSDYGLNYDEAKEQNIIFTPWFTKEKKTSKLHTPHKVVNKETGRETITPGGVFISGSFIAKLIPDYKYLSPRDLFGRFDAKQNKYIGGKIDQDILMNLIGYRIPNQALSSNDALMIAGILPEETGDTIIAYNGMTSKTGSDFDIDKMFFMMPSYYIKYSKNIRNKGIRYIKDNKLIVADLKRELVDLNYPLSALNNLSRDNIESLFIEEILLNDEKNTHYKLFKEAVKDNSAEKLIYARPKKDENGTEYPLHEQSLKVVQNKLIEAYKAILLSPHNIGQVMTSIDQPFIKKDSKNLHETNEIGDLENFNVLNDLLLKNEFIVGGNGLGQNVNSAVDAVRGGMGKQWFNNFNIPWGNLDKNNKLSLDDEYSKELTDKEIEDYVKSFNRKLTSKKDKITLEEVKRLKKVKLNDSMMALINAFVDIEKDPYIVKGNWNTNTNNIAFMMLRAGVHPFYVNAFIGQPILKEFIKFTNNKESKSIADTVDVLLKFKIKQSLKVLLESYKDNKISINNKNTTIENIFKRIMTVDNLDKLNNYIEDVEQGNDKSKRQYIEDKNQFEKIITNSLMVYFSLTSKEINENPILKDKLLNIKIDLLDAFEKVFEVNNINLHEVELNTLRNQIKVKPNTDIQLSVLAEFKRLIPAAKIVTASVNASKMDVNGKGKNITSLIIALNKIQAMVSQENEPDGLNGFTNKLRYAGKNTMLNTYKKNSGDEVYEVMRANPKFFLGASNSVVSTFNTISDEIYNSLLVNDKLGGKLEKAYYSYILSGFKPIQTTSEEKKELLTNLPSELIELQKKYKDNTLLNELVIKPGDNVDEFFISMPNLRKSVSYKNTLTDSWKDLLDTNPEFAEKLIKYSFLITGFNNSINQFHEFIPYEWFNKNRFNSYLKNIDLGQYVDDNFIDQFFKHNYKDTSIVKSVSRRSIISFTGDSYKTGYTNRYEGKTPYMTKLILKGREGDSTSYYYRRLGYNSAGKAVYVRTSVLGKKDSISNSIVEYNYNGIFSNGEHLSIDYSNRLKTNQINVDLLKEIKNITLSKFFTPSTSVVDENTIKKVKDISNNKLNQQIPENNLKPDVILPIGISGSGKSTFVKSLPQENLVVIEPDAMRVEFTGDINNKSKDKEIYVEAANRAIQAIKQGKQVVFDTTNLTKDKRFPFIEAIKKAIPNVNIQYKLMELNPELAKQRIKSDIAAGKNRANVSDATIDKHAIYYIKMLKDIKSEDITNFDKFQQIQIKNNIKNYYEGNIKPEPNTIFVFGSNPEGRHGAGAAKVAKDKFGAKYGQGEGLQGNAYALPTKDLRIKENRGFKSISSKQITKSIKKLYEVAKQNPTKQFKVAYRNTTETSLNGYTGLEMIEMFNDAGDIPFNIIFSKEWIDTGLIKYNNNSQLSLDINNKETINVYWGQPESNTSTRILSNLAPRKFTFKGKEYGSVEHAYQTNKSGTFDDITYNKYMKLGGYGKKIRGKGTIAEMKKADSLSLMKKLVIESFKQNSNSEAAKKLMQYKNFTHNTNQLIDQAFLKGLELAREFLINNYQKNNQLSLFEEEDPFKCK